MDFATEIAIGLSVTAACFLVFSGIILIRQRRRRRRSIHWFAVFLLSGLIGIFVGMGTHLSGTDPLASKAALDDSVRLNKDGPQP
jgi:uncharacterized membrane protein YfcA